MEDPIPNLFYYIRIAELKGISESSIRVQLIDLINETKSYLGAMKILTQRINSTKIDLNIGEANEKESENKLGRIF